MIVVNGGQNIKKPRNRQLAKRGCVVLVRVDDMGSSVSVFVHVAKEGERRVCCATCIAEFGDAFND